MYRGLRSLLLTCLLIAACTGGSPTAPVGAQPVALDIHSSSVPMKLDQPDLKRLGKLVWRGGISMTANSPNFGGWSDLQVAPDGKTLASISDVGSWLTATVEYDGEGNLIGLRDGRIGSLLGLDGKPLVEKDKADAEGMALLPDGSWLVSFERDHRIWHYPTLDGTPTAINLPEGFKRQPWNGGVETLTALTDGRLIAISEEYEVSPDLLAGWLGQPDGKDHYTWQSFRYTKIPDFNPTAIRALPNGGFVLLERAFDITRGVRIRIMTAEAADFRPGNVVTAREIARLASPLAVDNLEGVAAIAGPRGETLLWLISDDNFNALQRNLLLLFELTP